MKKLIIVLLIFSAWLSADIDWQKDIPSALSLAKQENKMLMVFVEGENCRWCKKMKYRTLGDEKVEQRLQAFIVVKVMQEDREAVKHLPAIDGVPTIFFINSDKKLLQDVVGYFDVDDFISYIDSVEKKVRK